MGPALDPSTMRIVVFPGVFWSSSSPISPIFTVKPASAKRRQIETNPRDSLGFFVFLNGFEVVLAEVRKHSGERTLCSCKLRLHRASPTLGLLSGRRAFWASVGFMPSGPRLAATEAELRGFFLLLPLGNRSEDRARADRSPNACSVTHKLGVCPRVFGHLHKHRRHRAPAIVD
jgi:hypothetical protein